MQNGTPPIYLSIMEGLTLVWGGGGVILFSAHIAVIVYEKSIHANGKMEQQERNMLLQLFKNWRHYKYNIMEQRGQKLAWY